MKQLHTACLLAMTFAVTLTACGSTAVANGQADDAKITAVIKKMKNTAYSERESVFKELQDLGVSALPATLKVAMNGRNPILAVQLLSVIGHWAANADAKGKKLARKGLAKIAASGPRQSRTPAKDVLEAIVTRLSPPKAEKPKAEKPKVEKPKAEKPKVPGMKIVIPGLPDPSEFGEIAQNIRQTISQLEKIAKATPAAAKVIGKQIAMLKKQADELKRFEGEMNRGNYGKILNQIRGQMGGGGRSDRDVP